MKRRAIIPESLARNRAGCLSIIKQMPVMPVAAAAAVNPVFTAGASPVSPPEAPWPSRTLDPDYQLFQRMLRGQVDIAGAMLALNHGRGWPLQVPGGFLVAVPEDGKIWSVAHDANGWQPQALQRQGSVQWGFLPDRPGMKYKLVDAGGNHLADPWARSYGYDEHGEYSLTKGVGAHLERWHGIGSAHISARTLRIWVPAAMPTHHLYAQDGQNLFAPDAPWGGWRLHEQAGSQTLVVGIDNSWDRLAEYTQTTETDEETGESVGGRGAAYCDFVEHVVRPFIEARYGRPRRTGILGASLGGLISFYQALLYPRRYDFAASLSGTFAWGASGDQSVPNRFAQGRPGNEVLYLDSGGGPGVDNYDETRAFADQLAAAGYVWDRSLFHWLAPDAPHNEAAWAKRVGRPLRLFESL